MTGIRILIIDDEIELCDMLRQTLAQQFENADVQTAYNAQDGLSIIRKQEIDVLITDIRMPGMDGIALMKQAGHIQKDLQTIVLTGHGDMDNVIKALRLGAENYMKKPVSVERLHIAIDNAWRKKQEIEARRTAEAALKKSEAQYRVLTEKIADGIALFQDEKIRFVNEAFSRMFGFKSPDTLIGKAPSFFIAKSYHQEFYDLRNALMRKTEGEHVFRCRCMRIDREEFWAEAHLNVIEWKGKPAVLSTVRDITGHMYREEAMQKESEHLRTENIRLKSGLKDRFRFGDIIGKSLAMQKIYEMILRAAASDAGVMIYGESGTGKELVARAIHDMSRSRGEFVAVNCGAIPETILEREFFGHKKGAFTGADTDIHGYLDLADGGSLLLDEVGELTLNMQVKLLRALDGKGYSPVGSSQTKHTDFRVIAATNKNLKALVQNGLMREDFFYRIHVIPIHLPRLCDRKDDIPLLIDHFMEKFNGYGDQPIPGDMLNAMYQYHWPGNVRELQNAVQQYISMNRIDFFEYPEKNSGCRAAEPADLPDTADLFPPGDLRQTLERFEKRYLKKALACNRWHRGHTARQLNIPPRTLHRKMKKYQIIPA